MDGDFLFSLLPYLPCYSIDRVRLQARETGTGREWRGKQGKETRRERETRGTSNMARDGERGWSEHTPFGTEYISRQTRLSE